MYHFQRFIPFAIAVSFLAVGVGWADDAITIEHHSPTATTRYYDANDPPREMPPPTPQEAGVTVSEFSCTALVTGSVISQSRDGKLIRASVRVDAVQLVVNLRITEWIRRDAPPKILAHENGHRKIAEMAYGNGDATSRAIAADILGVTFTASGKTVEQASSAALSAAADQVASAYLARVRDPSEVVQQLYDRVTAHGTNGVDEADAIAIAEREAGRVASSKGAATEPSATK